MSRPNRIRRPLARTSAARQEKFLEAGKKSQWPKGTSGNPAGMKRGTKIRDYKQFVEDCRALSPKALDRLREALELPFTKATARTILTASALVLERSYGRAVAISLDATPDRTTPAIPLNDQYWADMTAALRESGALTIPIEKKEEIVDAEVVESDATKLIEGPPK